MASSIQKPLLFATNQARAEATFSTATSLRVRAPAHASVAAHASFSAGSAGDSSSRFAASPAMAAGVSTDSFMAPHQNPLGPAAGAVACRAVAAPATSLTSTKHATLAYQTLEASELALRPESDAASQPAADVARPAEEQEVDELWLEIREEARRQAEEEPALASYLFSTILAHRSLESALASHLANKIGSATLLSTHLATLFRDVLLQSPAISAAVRRDMVAARTRDPACTSYLHCLLNFKGFAALQVHRIAHELWSRGRHSLALALQSQTSTVFHVDIHPGAKFGSGVLLDHATGIVVGETAEVGNDVSMLHGVTLGGSGVRDGNRHPKIRDGAVLGTGVKILGPVIVGKEVKAGAGSLVLEDVRDGATVVGSPAKEVQKKQDYGALFVLDYTI